MPNRRANLPSHPSVPAQGKTRLRQGMSPHKTVPGPGRGALDCFIHVRWAKSYRHATTDTFRPPHAPAKQTQKTGGESFRRINPTRLDDAGGTLRTDSLRGNRPTPATNARNAHSFPSILDRLRRCRNQSIVFPFVRSSPTPGSSARPGHKAVSGQLTVSPAVRPRPARRPGVPRMRPR